MKKLLSIVVVSLIVAVNTYAAEAKKEIVLASEVDWTFLNPKRGNLAPSAGTLWGDRNGKVATGYLLKPSDDFSSPPHIHNVSYRAIVIKGLLHNDDPEAANMWMPAGSFWTQPKGEIHITSAKGKDSLAYVEIESGPYLVLPKEMAFDSGERPVNIVPSNLVWLDADDTTWADQESGVQISYLWGERKGDAFNGSFVKLPADFKGKIKTTGTDFRAIVVKGLPTLTVKEETKELELGSYFNSLGAAATHEIASSKRGDETVLYVRTNGKYTIVANK